MEQLKDSHNVANLFFAQARRPELRDRPRFMVPAGREDGAGATEEWTPVTWADLSARVQRLGSFLLDRGVDRGVNVAVLCNTRLEWGVAALGLLAARGSLVPVYPTSTPEHLAHILGHSEAAALVVETPEHLARVLSVWDRVRVRTIVTVEPMDVQQLAREAGLDPAAIASLTFPLEQAEQLGAASLQGAPRRVLDRTAAIQLDDVAYLVYTSGTTGLPKGVPLTHRNVGVSGADWMEVNSHLIREGDVDLLWLPMSHLYGLGELCLGNQVGFTTYLSDPLHALLHMPRVRPHVFMSVPAYWEKLMQLARGTAEEPSEQHAALTKLTGGRLRFCLSGGAGLAREVKDFFFAAGLLIIEGYGLTECSPNLTFNRHDDFDFDTVGKPVPSVELRLAHDGEILARGDNVFAGYFKDPGATAAVFDDEGWFHTGDLGRWTDDGFLQIVGRKKEILVTAGGKNIPPVNIEQRFKDFPLVTHVMVHGDGKKYLTALVDIDDAVAVERLRAAGVPADEPRRSDVVRAWVQQCIDQVNQGLARHETIKAFCIAPEPLTVESNLLTPTLKLRRNNITARHGEMLEALYR